MGEASWYLADVEERHRQHPDTFEIPPVLARWNLREGQVVKLIFEKPSGGRSFAERMWVQVIAEVMPGRYRGRLQSKPTVIAGLRKGVEVVFGPEHVAFIIEEEH